MAYELHIEICDDEIYLDEWTAAANSVPGVRLSQKNVTATNPNSGEEIEVERADGDLEVLVKVGGFLGIGSKEEWIPAVRFSNGRASFMATADIESPKNPVRQAASALAAILGAKIVGDEGEEYNW